MRGCERALVPTALALAVTDCTPSAETTPDRSSYVHACKLRYAGGAKGQPSYAFSIGEVHVGAERHICISGETDGMDCFTRTVSFGTTIYTGEYPSPDFPPSTLTVQPDGSAVYETHRPHFDRHGYDTTRYAGTCIRRVRS